MAPQNRSKVIDYSAMKFVDRLNTLLVLAIGILT